MDGTIYSITFNATDPSGNTATAVVNTSVTYDVTLPVISATAPTTGSNVGNAKVSYTLSETALSGTITWTRTGGSVDGSVHTQALVGGELSSGAHTNITLTNNPTLVTGAIYTVAFDVIDLAGNAAVTVSSTNVTYDNMPPTITVTTPSTGSKVKDTKVSYTLSETALSGSITWTQTGGTADGASPHIQALTGAELNTGAHISITLSNDPTLVDGAIYSIAYNATDLSGNAATTVTNTNITYDVTAPVISATAPATSAYVKDTKVSYTLSEAIGSGSITWTQTGGTADGGSPHIQALTGTELNTGAHTNITLTNNPTLVSGSIYTVTFNATDAAGNAATTVTNTSVTFDNTLPVISATAPTTGSKVKDTKVSYTLSETVLSGSITWTQTGGTADGGTPHIQALSGAELNSGAHTNITLANNPTLVDGSIYSIAYNATDPSGNAATTVTNTNITYDVTAPVISATAPATSAYVKDAKVSYTLSEAIASGSITWTQTGGTADGASPHIQSLTGTELNTGAHTSITLTNNPTLVDGSIYTITFNATDPAGNTATMVTNTGITYDVTLPVISATAPATSAYVKDTKVSYTLSETALSGTITWTRTGGSVDGSVHTQSLVGGELTSGAHANITLTNDPTLVSGAIYTVAFNVTDLAGNAATTVSNTGVTFDNTAPVISATAPATSAYVKDTKVSYTLSEAASAGSVTWTQTGGTADGGSPHIQALAGAELNTGAHANITLSNNPTLVDGAVYSIAFNATDLSGNTATSVTNTSITYDATLPVISATAPTTGSNVGNAKVSYTLSETALSGTVTWTRTGGSADGSVHTQALVGGELASGAHTNITLTNNPTLVTGAIYTVAFDVIDLAGNAAVTVSSTNVTYDNTPPTITVTAPSTGSKVKDTKVSYTLSETALSGSITWTQTGGTADGASPHIQALTGAELNTGAHTSITLSNDPTLVDGAIYSIAYNATDLSGNAATTVTNTNITYDVTAPVISATAPATSTYVKDTKVSYTLSEAIGSGSITWTQTGGTADGGSPHIQALTGTELNTGAHTNITLTNNPTLVSGSIYTVTFNATDAAGNAATTVTNTSVTFDNTVPVISATAPTTGSSVNNTKVSYTLSETALSGTVTWTRTGGTADGSVHTQSLVGGELASGAHTDITLSNNPTLVNGAIYTVAFDVTDLAGNAATTVSSTGVIYDVTPPVISATAPATSAYVKDTKVSYTLSKAITSGSITWTQTGGSADGGSPHIQALTGTELNSGAHATITLTNNPTLVDGAVYSITYNGTDAAGNSATPVVNTGITYDVTLPVISATAPATSAYVKDTKVSYTLSEAAISGSITWTRTAGAADGSVHTQALVGGELASGVHANITLTNDPTLVSGAIYTVAFNVTDLAGNAATDVSNTGVTFDNTAPVISATAPATNAYVKDTKVSYTLSEAASAGTITWTRTGGTADGSIHTQSLVGGELSSGAHTSITLTNDPALVDGAIYSIAFNATDLSGNTATAVTNTSVTYDVTLPVISATAPTTGSNVGDAKVSYTLSEIVLSGTVTWTRTGGSADGSVHTQALVGGELTSGAHTNITLTNNPTLVTGAIYTVAFDVIDLAGNAAVTVSSTSVTYDNTPPTITVTTPSTGSKVKDTKVSYTLSETALSGSITWTQTGGTADGASPHIQALSGAELNSGAHTNITLSNDPTLVDGAIYSIAYNATDLSGNAATTVTNTNITYDVTAPVISATAPATSAYVKDTKVSYTLSEAIASGSITWTQTGGTADGGSPHIQALAGAELNTGAHANITLASNPTLVSGSIYTVTFNGTDAAGNAATAVVNTSIAFDNTVPVISATAPTTGSSINNTKVSYTLSETALSGTVTWTRTGGTADGSVHTQSLTGGELTSGAHTDITLTNDPTLVNGSIYTVAFDVTDLAGNAATTISNTNVIYDVTPPVISATAPATSAYVKDTKVSYTLSKAITSGSITWTQTGGSVDGGSPHIQALTGTELNSGAHANITLTNNPTLVDGAVYSITYNGTDAAGNSATPVVNTGITYDVTLPVISATAPATSAYVKDTKVSYTLSEAAISGSITWTRTAGAADGSVHTQALVGGELASGVHANITLTNDPTLVSGAIYTVAFNVTDLAGNAATAVSNTGVTFDNTAPVISATAPATNAYVKDTKVSYTLSEAASAGTITWTRTGGTADGSIHTQSLVGGELSSGAHTSITLTNDPALVDGAIYSIAFNATDLSGNTATAVTNTSVTYDVTLPVISATAPTTGSNVGDAKVSYTLSEIVLSGTVTWTRTGGSADGSVHTQVLVGGELSSGAHTNITLTNNPTLVTGAVYTVAFDVIDLAGNAAVTVSSTSVTYDNTPPTITVTTPSTGSKVKDTKVSYTLSETALSGSITWTQTGGTADGASPHIQALSGAELNSGAHTNITLSNDPTLVDGAIYSIAYNATDLSGNAATTVTNTNITYDVTAPVISATAPATSAYVKDTKVSYTLSEAIASGSITWAQTGGTADGGSPHIQALAGAELNAGAHANITLASNPTLVSGSIYTVTFNGTDAAGNAATSVANTSVTFDNTVPVISATAPTTGSSVNNTKVSYTLSETALSGTVTWTRTGGAADGSVHTQSLTGGELASGAHTDINLTNDPTLVNGSIYTVAFDVTDLAGNAATTISNTNVIYDVTPPVISATAPATSAYAKDTKVSYTLSKAITSGSITWTQTGGAADAGSPHVQSLTGVELNTGAHTNTTLTNNPTLVSGAIYSITYNGTDAAGNSATPVVNTSITFDNTLPVISATAPTTGSNVNNTKVSYTLSETALSGTVTWTRTGGTADGSVHTQALTGGELASGVHTDITLSNNPALVNGSIYTISFDITDLAGNAATMVSNTNVTYDVTAPVISATAPVTSAYVKDTKVSYTLSEAISSGTITWTRTNGTADGASPHAQVLSGAELNAGVHSGITLANAPTLVDGAIYTITFNATDLAGNNATPVANTGIAYDVTIPVISATGPATGTFIDDANVSYTLSETALSGTITWTQTGGPADVGAPHILSLVGGELSSGVHSDITLTNNPTLVSGTIYTVTFDVTDLAGNVAVTVSNTNVAFDNVPPAITATTPTTGSYVKDTKVSYTLSKNVVSGSVTWTRTGGSADAGSPHIQALAGGELAGGVHTNITLTNNPTLADGAIYTITYNATDAASNNATPVSNTNILYDVTLPVISEAAPVTGSYVKDTKVSFTLSETALSGTIKWTRTAGTADGSIHTQSLNGTELNSGAHTNITLTNAPTLVDGAIYSIAFDATDLAGNAAVTITSTNITYDITVPVISATAPATGSNVKDAKVSYTLSEAALSGTIIWSRTGGTADGSIHTQSLAGGELNSGAHANITLTNAPTLVDGAIYSIAYDVTDFAGNAALTVTNTNITYDVSAPVISATAPATGSYVKDTKVSYTLSEAITSGTITWAQTGGTADAGSPHLQVLTGAELNTGAHSSITLTNNPILVSDAIYSMTFNGADAAGNTATPVVNTAITFDNTLPVISATAPTTGSIVNNAKVSYTLSETALSGSVTWTQTAGTADGASPHTQALTGGELASGAHTSITLTNNPTLVDGAIYTIAFNVTDLAGNAAVVVSNTNITYDVTPPAITVTAPSTGSYVKDTKVSYTLSKAIASGSITWTQTGGTADGASPHIQALAGAELNSGAHTSITLTNNPTLVDGAIYSISYNGTDAAGNSATPVVNTNIIYDITLPVISATSPSSNAYVKDTKVSYTLSEMALSGSITWTRTSGTADAGSPHTQVLSGGELNNGAHTNITLTNNPTLVSGTVYTIAFDATDLAGNAAVTVSSTNVTFDNTVPTITLTAPVTSAYVKDTKVSYTLSESALSGSITWTRTGGTD